MLQAATTAANVTKFLFILYLLLETIKVQGLLPTTLGMGGKNQQKELDSKAPIIARVCSDQILTGIKRAHSIVYLLSHVK